MSFAQKHFEGILQLWYPGARGGNAVAEILFGKESPSGKLPVTFYETLSELPSFEDYSMSGRTYRYMKGKAQYPVSFRVRTNLWKGGSPLSRSGGNRNRSKCFREGGKYGRKRYL